MIDRLQAPLVRTWFNAPVFADDERTRQARLLHRMLLMTMAIVTATAIVVLFFMPQNVWRWVAIVLFVDGLAVGLLVVNSRGHTQIASIVLVIGLGLFASALAVTAGGVVSPAAMTFIIVVLFAALLLGVRAAIFTTILVGLAGFALVYLEAKNLLPQRTVSHTPLTFWISSLMLIGLALSVQWLSIRSIRDALVRARSELVDRLRTEQQLRDSESRFRALADATFEGIGLTEHGVFIDANDQLATILGTTRTDLIGKPVINFVAPESHDVVRRAIQAESTGPYEHLAIRTDGTVFPVEVRARVMTIGERHTRVTVIRDITQRKQAEAALQESTERLRSLGDNLPNGMVYQAIREHDGTMRFVYVSAGVEHIFGVTPDALLNDSSLFRNRILAEDLTLVEAKRNESLRDLSVFHLEVRMRGAGDDVRWVQISSAPRRLPDGRILWDGILLDITARKEAEAERLRLEAQLREAQKMEALGVLAGGVAHDFNNILTAIRGNTKLAAEDLPAGYLPQRSLAEIEKASARAADLVRRILTFSRREEPVRKVLQLEPVIKEALGLLRITLPPLIEVHTRFAASLPPVAADATQIHQIVMNLGTNAAQAMAEHGGRLDIALEVTTVDPALARALPDLREGRYVRLSFSDTGHGMDRATLDRIFEPFFTTKIDNQGTGLGLSVVHGIVKNHDGAITVESEVGKGATFQIYFPAVEQATVDAKRSAQTVSHGQGQRVLYIDDEEALVFLATRMLERAGYRVTGFIDPQHALDAFRSKPDEYDVVVTDLSMPGMPGSELARELQRIRPDVPIILTSGYIRSGESELAKRLGVRAVILKPNTVDELANTLHRLFIDERDAEGA